MIENLSDDELRARLTQRLVRVANPEDAIERLIARRDDPEFATKIQEIIDP